MRNLFYSSLLLLVLVGCSGEPDTGPGKVRWDREICPRCAMVISDHNYAAQVRGGPAEKKAKLYTFDDIGCAVIWLDKQDWKDDARTEIWVSNHANGDWLDARTAQYVTGKITPMGYGLGAQTKPSEGSLNYEQAKQHIYEVEEREHIHAGNATHALESVKE